MIEFITKVIFHLKAQPGYVLYLFQTHTIITIIAAALFVFVVFFSNKVANKMRSIFVLASLLLIVFSFISRSWTRIMMILLGLCVLLAVRIFFYVISEIRITRHNKRLEERALEKAAKRRGSWSNKQGYSGARKLIVEPEYIPEEMNHKEIKEIIENEFSDKKEESPVPASAEEVISAVKDDSDETTATEELTE